MSKNTVELSNFGAKNLHINSQCVVRALINVGEFYENLASPFYMHIFILFSLMVLIWRKIVLKKGSRFELRSPAQQSTVLSPHPVIKTIIMDIYNLVP